MWLLLAGAAIGISGAVTWLDERRRQRRARDNLGDGAEASEQRPSESGCDEARPTLESGGLQQRFPTCTVAALAVSLGSLMVVAGGALLVRRYSAQNPTRRSARKGPPRIPLKELVRFREQQWFLEELENARDGDPNSMLRLAKMYLYGQGCERNVNIAQEWLRRARAGGVFCTLDELLTAEDLDAIRRQGRTANAERRQHHLQHPSRPITSISSERH